MPAKFRGTPEEYLKDFLERLIEKTVEEGDCWRYTGKLVGKGYGEIWYQGKGRRLNRIIAHIYHGLPLDSELNANHTRNCRFNNCWRPEHIYIGTQQENVDDQIAMGRFNYGSNNINGGSNFNKENWLGKRHPHLVGRTK
jgi:hypothetical protein